MWLKFPKRVFWAVQSGRGAHGVTGMFRRFAWKGRNLRHYLFNAYLRLNSWNICQCVWMDNASGYHTMHVGTGCSSTYHRTDRSDLSNFPSSSGLVYRSKIRSHSLAEMFTYDLSGIPQIHLTSEIISLSHLYSNLLLTNKDSLIPFLSFKYN